MKLQQDFYMFDAITVAKELLGKKLVRKNDKGLSSGIIVETEAYMGLIDKAAHASRGKTKRTEILFENGGRAYVYMIYGMHHCMNITVNSTNIPECVLIRALHPLDGIEIMKNERKTEKLENLCSGPGKLCKAMGITVKDNGIDLCGNDIYIEDTAYRDLEIIKSKRINIDYAKEAKDYEWRFLINL